MSRAFLFLGCESQDCGRFESGNSNTGSKTQVGEEDKVSRAGHFGAAAAFAEGGARSVHGGEAEEGVGGGTADERAGKSVGVPGEGMKSEATKQSGGEVRKADLKIGQYTGGGKDE